MDMKKIAPLFEGWDETLIWSCLQGYMGHAVADDEENPASARIVIGDFCFLAGKASRAFAAGAEAPIIVPQNPLWEEAVEAAWGDRVTKALRYAVKKEPGVFDPAKLKAFSTSLDKKYTLCLFDETIFLAARREKWSADFCVQFVDYTDFRKRGLGVAVLYKGALVAGASSYCVYNGGIEIEIDTRPDFRRRGLAAACGARLILECLDRGLYPSWDAHDLRSMALAEKLGYHMDRPYTVYIKSS